ncbi:MAG: glyoxalase/bleomycin resistance protein/dioxygenase [Puniceicoccaceae bacterium 5H]|nr:MAG: glyoxalase/bleomycin resistance protein/dioxygenase [Puniceicoccaceae bacterium 5H]
MLFEHFALNVPDAAAMADWYVENLGFRILKAGEKAPFVRFLGDSSGRCIAELYTNPQAPVPDYATQHHLVFHFAVVAADAEQKRDALLAAGATLVVEDTTSDGSLVITLRDPWGVPVQLCRRVTPLGDLSAEATR